MTEEFCLSDKEFKIDYKTVEHKNGNYGKKAILSEDVKRYIVELIDYFESTSKDLGYELKDYAFSTREIVKVIQEFAGEGLI